MNKKLIEGTHYSVSEDGKVWNEKLKKEVKVHNGSVTVFDLNHQQVNISIRKFLRLYFPQSIEVPEVEGTEHKSIGNYQVYNNGQVWSKKHFKFLSLHPNKFGHLNVLIDGKAKKIHRLVYQIFVGPIPNGCDIHHKDFNKRNNSISNLICLTHAEHSKLHGELREPMSEEAKQHLSELNKGKVLTVEHKAKIAASKKAWWEKVKANKQ